MQLNYSERMVWFLMLRMIFYDCLSCDQKISSNKKKSWLRQKKRYGEWVMGMWNYKAPGMPIFWLCNLQKMKIKNLRKTKHHFDLKLRCHYILWNTQDQTLQMHWEVIDSDNKAEILEMHHVIEHVLDTKNLGLKIKLNRDMNKLWNIFCFSDSDYAGDPDAKRNVTGLILYILGVPFSWSQSTDKHVLITFKRCVSSAIQSCKWSYIHDPVTEKHKNIS